MHSLSKEGGLIKEFIDTFGFKRIIKRKKLERLGSDFLLKENKYNNNFHNGEFDPGSG